MSATDDQHPTTGEAGDAESAPVHTVYRGTGVMWSAVVVLVGIAVMVVIALQNTHDVAFEVLWADLSVPLVVLLLITIGVTILLDEVVGYIWRRRRRNRLSERQELKRLRAERSTS